MTSVESSAATGLTDVLSAILRSRGAAALDDRRRLLGLLRDKAPAESRATRILMAAFDQGIPARLRQGTVSEIDIGREVAHLTSEAGIAPDLARAAVVTWASALTDYRPPAALYEANPVSPAGTAPQPVQPLPTGPLSVQPLPVQPSAMVSPLPAAPPAMPQAVPSVQPLPVQPLPLAAAAAPKQDKWRVLRLVLGGVIVLAGAAKLYDALTHWHEQTTTQQPPAQSPQQPPAQSPQQPPAQSPQSTPVTQTPEGVSVLKTENPLPHLRANRVNNDPNSLTVYFGLPVGNVGLSYQVNFVFAKNQQHGLGFAAAFSGNQTASTGAIGADHYWKSDTKEMSLVLSGPTTTNPFNAPSVCIIARVGPRLDRIDLDSTSFVGAFGVKGSEAGAGSCDTDKVYGFGYLQ